MAKIADIRLATKAVVKTPRGEPRPIGMALIIVEEAQRAGIPVSLGFALIEQETGFQNIFGHDPTIFVGAGKVTKQKYLSYKSRRGPTGRGGMQGVGPGQLTWYATQDAADRLGGCWVPRYNIRVAFTTLEGNIKSKGLHSGIAAYNGTGPAAQRYADTVLARQAKWHNRLK